MGTTSEYGNSEGETEEQHTLLEIAASDVEYGFSEVDDMVLESFGKPAPGQRVLTFHPHIHPGLVVKVTVEGGRKSDGE